MNKEEIKALLASMSLEEKIGQMLQIAGSLLQKDTVITGPMRESGLSENNLKLAGSVIGLEDAQSIIDTQKRAMENQPHAIPLLFMLDIINGFKTIFPIPLAQGATFNPELIEKCAEIAAKEAAVSGIHVSFAPMVDLVRDARWGRVMESFGEDPYLNSLFCQSVVRGFQGKALKENNRIAACVKHFAAYGAPTAGRDYNTVELSEHTLRQFYYPAYQAGIDEGCALVMTAFNTINGIPATGNKKLMRDVLRKEMGFDKVLISDWAAIEELIYHGYCKDKKEAAFRSLEAGVDIDMMTGIYTRYLEELVQSNRVDEKLIDEAVERILNLKNDLGLFENPIKNANPELEKQVHLCKEHRAIAYQAATESIVLLKNEILLPLNSNQKIAIIGPYVESKQLMGSWSIAGGTDAVVSLKEAAQTRLHDVTYHQGCAMVGDDVILEAFDQGGSSAIQLERFTLEQKKTMLQEAIASAKEADCVVMALGEHYLQSGEACSKAEITLPQVQLDLLSKIAEVNQNIVVVLFNGRPLDLRGVLPYAKSIVEAWLPGVEGGNAVLDILLGKVSPSAKLPMSFPYSVGQIPVYYNEYSTGRPHQPVKDKDKFRSKYLDIPNAPLYCFGYGLSYTTFELSKLQLSKQTMRKEETLTVSCILHNVGDVEATETVQLYIQDVFASVVRPVKELKAIQKVQLKPHSEQQVQFIITSKMLEFYDADAKLKTEPGMFRVFIGQDSAVETYLEFELLKEGLLHAEI